MQKCGVNFFFVTLLEPSLTFYDQNRLFFLRADHWLFKKTYDYTKVLQNNQNLLSTICHRSGAKH